MSSMFSMHRGGAADRSPSHDASATRRAMNTVSIYQDNALPSLDWTQVDENDVAQFVVVNEPALPNWMGSCHPNGSLYEKPLDLRAAQQEHMKFREVLESSGCTVRTVREILAQDCDVDVMARVQLEELAMNAMTYELTKTGNGLDDSSLTSTEKHLLSAEYKRSCIEKMDTEQLVEVVLTRPTILLEKADKDTELLVVNYTYEPLVNLIFCRDQQITTAKGVVMGRPRSRIRQREVEVMEFCFKKLGVPVIGNITSPGTLEGGDFFPVGEELCMIGVGLRSNMDAVEYLLENDLLGTERVAVVKDYFDQHQQRMHLDTVFNVIAPKVCLMLKDIQGEESPKRRLVDEYAKNASTGKYELVRHDIEFLRYVEEEGYTVITLTNEMQIDYGCNGLNLGNNTMVTVDRATAKFIARSHKFHGKIIVVDFTNNTNMFGSVHCCSQVISRRKGSAPKPSPASDARLEFTSPTKSSSAEASQRQSGAKDAVQGGKVAERVSANIARKFIMVAPNNFDVNQATAQDNLLMAASHERFLQKIHQKGQGRRDVHSLLVSEFAELHRVLTVKHGAEVYLFTHELFHHSPDALFVSDWFETFAAGDVDPSASLALLPMKAPTRRTERRADLVQFLSKEYSNILNFAACESGELAVSNSFSATLSTETKLTRPLEASSFVPDRDTKMAYAARTCTRLDLEALKLWSEKTGFSTVLFDLDVDSTSPHVALLRSAHHTRVFLAVFSSFAFVCTEAIAPHDRTRILDLLNAPHPVTGQKKTVIDFTLAQCKHLAITGAVEIISRANNGKSVLILSATARAAFTPAQLATLKSIDIPVESVNLSEIEQLGGGSISGLIGCMH